MLAWGKPSAEVAIRVPWRWLLTKASARAGSIRYRSESYMFPPVPTAHCLLPTRLRSLDGHAAVDDQGVARDPGRFVAGEVERRLGDLLRLADALHRDARGRAGQPGAAVQ